MKNAFLFLKKNKKDVLLIVLLVFLTFKAWQMLPEFTIRGDGFASMLTYNQKAFWGTPYYLASIVLSEMILGAILPKIFGVNLSYYYWLEVFVLIVIAIEFYFLVKTVTKNHLTSFSASLIASVSYFGVYDMVSTHCYCFFLERVIPVLFLLPSFLFLHIFLEKNNKKFYIISLLFYFFGVGIGHFIVLFTPFYFLYPFFWHLLNKKGMRERIKGLLYGLSYLFLSIFFIAIQQINESGISPHEWTFTQFLLDPQKYLYFKKIGLQFVYWSQYPSLLKDFAQNPMSYIIDHRIAGSYIPLVVIVYALAASIIYKFLPKQRAMLFTIALGVPIIFYMNAYIGQYDMLNFSGASRYLYYPTFLISIFWSYFLWAVFWRKKNILLVGGFLLLLIYYMLNVRVIKGNSFYEVLWNVPPRSIFDHVISQRSKLSSNTLIIVTYPEFGSQEASFFTQQIGKGKVRYMSDNNLVNAPDTWENISSASAHVIKLRYDKNCSCAIEDKIK